MKHTNTHEQTTTELPLTRRLYALGPPAVVSGKSQCLFRVIHAERPQINNTLPQSI